MMMMGAFEALIIFLVSGMPTDVVSFLDPKMALEILGEGTDEASLRRLIEGKPSAPGDASPLDEKATKTAVENLASSSDAVKAKAREKLVSLGEAVRARLDGVVANDPRRAAEAKKVLAELDAAAKSSASRLGVSRLLAVRLAGDQRIQPLADPIRALAASKDPFLSAAAAETVARIEGKSPPPPPPRPWAKSFAALEALPAGTNYIIDLPSSTMIAEMAGTASLRIDQMLKPLAGMMGPEGAADSMIREATKGILDVAVKCGNARIDRASLANVGQMSRTAGLALILCGEYEPQLLEKGIQGFGSWKVEEVGGKRLLASREVRLLLLDEHHVVVLFEHASDNFPLADYVAAYTSGSKPLRGAARWAKFLGTLGDAARALVLIDSSLVPPGGYDSLDREGLAPDVVAAVKGMREIEAEAKVLDSKRFGYRLEAAFEDAKQATDLAEFVKGKIAEGIAVVEQQAPQMAGTPVEGMMKAAIEVMKSIKVVGDGKKGILRGELDPTFLMTFFGMSTLRVAPAQFEEGQ